MQRCRIHIIRILLLLLITIGSTAVWGNYYSSYLSSIASDGMRYHLWDDNDRLLLAINDKNCGFCGYSGDGKRKYKMTGEVVGRGEKEIYAQYRRDYKEHPMTEGEKKQRNKWADACRLAGVIVRDKNHPRYMEMYERWREHLKSGEPAKQFKNFICGVLASE